jgi:hypothetical protein
VRSAARFNEELEEEYPRLSKLLDDSPGHAVNRAIPNHRSKRR